MLTGNGHQCRKKIHFHGDVLDPHLSGEAVAVQLSAALSEAQMASCKADELLFNSKV